LSSLFFVTFLYFPFFSAQRGKPIAAQGVTRYHARESLSGANHGVGNRQPLHSVV
jgi:hypothetical protein